MKQELVKDWMNWDPITISPDTELPEIQQLMAHNSIRRLPVVKDGRLVGIVTQGDMRSGIALSISDEADLVTSFSAEELMTPNPATISPDTTIGEAAMLMRNHKISGIPVVNDAHQVIGIITESDIFDMVVQTWSE